jgi:ferredoxin-NADP reductase
MTSLCRSKELIAPSVIELRLQKPPGFTFRPGQYVLFDVPLLLNPEDVQTRAYSIASTPFEKELLFVIKLVHGGRASEWLKEQISPGTPIILQGPFGRFTLDRETENPYLLIATGTGVAPFRSQLKWALEEEQERRKIDLIFGVLQLEDFFWLETLQDLERRFSNLRIHASALSGEPDWHGETGSVQERLRRLVSDPQHVSLYLCGAPDMVREVKEICLRELHVPKENLHQEAYI